MLTSIRFTSLLQIVQIMQIVQMAVGRAGFVVELKRSLMNADKTQNCIHAEHLESQKPSMF